MKYNWKAALLIVIFALVLFGISEAQGIYGKTRIVSETLFKSINELHVIAITKGVDGSDKAIKKIYRVDKEGKIFLGETITGKITPAHYVGESIKFKK